MTKYWQPSKPHLAKATETMHELSVCQSIVDQVSNIARQYDDCTVENIYIRLGPLSGIIAELLQSAFPLASANTVAAHANLVIESMPIRVRCMACGSDTAASANRLVCGSCGHWQTTLLSGDEMILQRIELQPVQH